MGIFLQTLHVGFSQVRRLSAWMYNVKYNLGRTRALAAESVAVMKRVLTDEVVISHFNLSVTLNDTTVIIVVNCNIYIKKSQCLLKCL